MIALVFDTETTGKALFDRPPTDPGQPHIMQLACKLIDDQTGQSHGSFSTLIKPEGWTCSPEAEAVHHISIETANRFGLSQHLVLGIFNEFLSKADYLAGHNVKFDLIIVLTAYHALGQTFPSKVAFCTMQALTPICKLPGPHGFKWPKLEEAMQCVFHETLPDAHDAMVDVNACARLLVWLKTGQKEVSSTQTKIIPVAADKEYTDETPMPFGKHKGIPLADVPPDYFVWLKNSGCNHKQLKAYINAHWEEIQADTQNTTD